MHFIIRLKTYSCTHAHTHTAISYMGQNQLMNSITIARTHNSQTNISGMIAQEVSVREC